MNGQAFGRESEERNRLEDIGLAVQIMLLVERIFKKNQLKGRGVK
jgi:hypothetical protein